MANLVKLNKNKEKPATKSREGKPSTPPKEPEKLTKRDSATLLAAQCIRAHLRGINLYDDEARDQALDEAQQAWLEQANDIFSFALDHLGLADEA
jgi:hypothetical protein